MGRGKDGLEEQFYHKAHFLLDNGEELGLSDDQINQIKELKLSTKKALITKDAEIEVLAMDVQAEMHKETIDKEALHRLIDKKYDLKKEKAKSIASAYAALKGIVTKEQKDKMKAIWKRCEKENEQYKKCKMMKDH